MKLDSKFVKKNNKRQDSLHLKNVGALPNDLPVITIYVSSNDRFLKSNFIRYHNAVTQ